MHLCLITVLVRLAKSLLAWRRRECFRVYTCCQHLIDMLPLKMWPINMKYYMDIAMSVVKGNRTIECDVLPESQCSS
mgnify:CR=1 FL=1